MLKKLKILFSLLFLFSSFMAKAETINEDFILTLKESFLSKAFVNQRNFEYKDNQGNYLKNELFLVQIGDFVYSSPQLTKESYSEYDEGDYFYTKFDETIFMFPPVDFYSIFNELQNKCSCCYCN